MSGIAWVTGASQGLGAAVALRLAEMGWTVAASARGEAGLADLAADPRAQGRIHAVACDVTDGAANAAAVARIEAEIGPIALAILNAGTHQPLRFRALDAAVFQKLFDINVLGAVHGIVALRPAMAARKAGTIAVVASVAGYRGLPTAAAYGMTKAGVINMVESMRHEAAADGIDMRVVNPGFVRTPLTDKNDFPMPFLMEPDAAAQRMIDGLTRSTRFEIAFPTRFVLILKLLRMLPYGLYFRLTRGAVPKD